MAEEFDLGTLGQLGAADPSAGDPQMQMLLYKQMLARALRQRQGGQQAPMVSPWQVYGSVAKDISDAWTERSTLDEIRQASKDQAAQSSGMMDKAMEFIRSSGGAPAAAPAATPVPAQEQMANPMPSDWGGPRAPLAAKDMAPHQAEFLQRLSGPESGGDYAVMYGGTRFDPALGHPNNAVPITTGPDAGSGKTSSAAGRYQFIAPTWQSAAAAAGVDPKDFSPATQDRVAWSHAGQTYKGATGRDLDTDLQSSDPAVRRGIEVALRGQWPSLPGGGQEGRGAGLGPPGTGGGQPMAAALVDPRISSTTTQPQTMASGGVAPAQAGEAMSPKMRASIMAAVLSGRPNGAAAGKVLAAYAAGMPGGEITDKAVQQRIAIARGGHDPNFTLAPSARRYNEAGQEIAHNPNDPTTTRLTVANDLKGEGAFATTVGAGLGKTALEAIDTGNAARDQIASARRVRQLLDENPITGPGQDIRLKIAKGLNFIGLTDAEQITSTQNLMSELAKTTLTHVKSSGLGAGQGFTNTDRIFVEEASAGRIEFTPQAMRRMADINERVGHLMISRGNQALDRLRNNKNTASMVEGMPNIEAPGPDAPAWGPVGAGGARGAAPGGAVAAPVPVRSPEDARKLPSGTAIILPDGSVGRVP